MGQPFPPAGADRPPVGVVRVLAGLVLFGVAFGFVEAAVVVYLRGLYEPVHQRAFPGRPPHDLFPVLTLDHVRAEGPQAMSWLLTELAREVATLALLAAPGLLVARNFRQWLAAFLIPFGVWDVFYYVFLRVLIGWPTSLFDWDLLFLVPVPWAGPVLAPVLVALTMIAAGGLTLWRELGGRPMPLRWYHWSAVVGGGIVIVLAFCWDCPNLLAGGLPNRFAWPLLLAGEAVAVAGFAHAFGRS